MRIALVNPPNKPNQYYDSSHYFSHLGLGYIASSLEAKGFKVDCYETYLEGITQKELVEKLTEGNYDAIGFTSYYYNIFEVVRIARKVKKEKDIFIFVGGIYASTNYKDILTESCIDCCVLGEGEITVVNLMESISQKKNWREISGIAYTMQKDIVISKQKCINILDDLHFPRREYIFKNKIASMIASRGCNGNCSFCGIRSYYNEFTTNDIRIRSPENVVKEIKFLIETQNIEYIYFQDENFFSIFNIDCCWIHNFCNLIQKENLVFKFYLYARADDILKYESVLGKLKQAGLQCIFVGVESFIDRQLMLFNKKTTREINLRAIQILKKYSFDLIIGFIPFDPFTTIKELYENISILYSTKFYENSFFGQTPISCLSPLYPMPFTQFYKLLNDKDLYVPKIPHKYVFQDSNTQALYEELRFWREKTKKEYEAIDNKYKNTRYDEYENQLLLRQLRELLKKDLEFLQRLCYDRLR